MMDLGEELWISTGNPSKLKELSALATIHLPGRHALRAREARGVVENADTYLGNARIKAVSLVNELVAEGKREFSVLGDDSGISVDLLEGAPGLYSARYAGSPADSAANVRKLLVDIGARSMKLEERSAQYRCALWLIRVSGGQIALELQVEGVLPGLVAFEGKGTYGYAYDPVFLNPETRRSYAELTFEEKNRDSHRSRAFAQLNELLSSSQLPS